jgi:hypothetical protein
MMEVWIEGAAHSGRSLRSVLKRSHNVSTGIRVRVADNQAQGRTGRHALKPPLPEWFDIPYAKRNHSSARESHRNAPDHARR